MRYYTAAQLSERISETPEGFLLCEGVPVARAGELLYAEGELTAEDGSDAIEAKDGIIKVTRGTDDLFSPETIASFEGKPVTLNHPEDFVAPDNWREVAVGHMQNVREGEGEDADKLLADLLITDREAIYAIKSKTMREVSLGYDAEYEQLEPGKGKQTNIKGNHIALVRRGRNGPSVAIRDAAPDNQPRKQSMKDKLMKLLGRAVDEAMPDDVTADAKDQDPMEARLAKLEEMVGKLVEMEVSEEETETEVMDEKAKSLDERIAAMEAAIAKLIEKPDGKVEEEAEAKDECKAMDAETIARAEILAPGLEASPKLVSEALAVFGKTTDGAAILKTFDGLPEDAKFIAAAELVRTKRAANARPTFDSLPSMGSGPMTAEKLNQLNAERYGTKGA